MRRIILTVLLGCLGLPTWGQTATITLAWDASARATGYRLSYGRSSGVYDTVLDVGSPTSASVGGLTPGLTYFFAATAYNTAGTSGYSNEVSYRVPGVQPPDITPPTVAIISPTDGADVPRSRGRTPSLIPVLVYAADDVGVVRVSMTVNGKALCTTVALPYQCLWEVPAPPRRIYTIRAIAVDAAGNEAMRSVEVVSR
jgi:hypothetical protein